jgi:hypothetical protein
MLADWEAIADSGALDDTLVRYLEQEARVLSCSSSEKSSTPPSGPKRRGRGSFLYDKSVLYSDQCGSERDLDDKESSPQSGPKGHINEQENKAVTAARQFGIRHVLILYDFPPSTRTTDLERIFEKFGDHGVAIRWVNDTSALAVFRTPSTGTLILTALYNPISTWLFFGHNLKRDTTQVPPVSGMLGMNVILWSSPK